MDNGPGFEPRDTDLPDHAVYCVDCGTIYIFGGTERTCPSCHVAERLDELEARLDERGDGQ